ncbi:hypothetical protein L3N51_02156 [Metallosphaera sp. J1]|nr:hypothetical protein [Metallosphaera javensis (ex Hofmann et al. 2022)]
MVSGLSCREDVIEWLNRLGARVIGLGDVECPQRIRNFKGILGEMDSITATKYMERNNLLFTREGDLSVDFSTPYVIVHEPPFGVGTGLVNGVSIGSLAVRAKILTHRPLLVFHGHSEVQKEVDFEGTRVVSVGLGSLGQFVEYFGNGKYRFIAI